MTKEILITKVLTCNDLWQSSSKVSHKPFQRLAVSKGRAFGRSPQRAKYFMLLKAQEGRKTFLWNVFRREPSQGVPYGTNVDDKRKSGGQSPPFGDKRC